MKKKIIDKALFERFKVFMNSLEESRIAVLHHTDPDGVCSGVIVSKAVERIRKKKIDLRLNQRGDQLSIQRETIEILKKNKIDKLIIVDMGVDQHPDSIRKIESFAEILIIDHHKIYNSLDSEKTIFIKPQTIFDDANPSSYCASKLSFDLCSEITDMNDLDWVSSIGIIGDCAFERWSDFLDKVFQKYSIKKKNNVFDTKAGKTAAMMSQAESFSFKKVEEIFNTVYESKNYDGILKSPLKKIQKKVQDEIMYWMENVESLAEFDDENELIIYKIEPKFAVKSNISTLLSLKYPHKTILILQDIDQDMVGVSARRRDLKVAVNDLLENATKKLEKASGGGHIPAAGGKFLKCDLSKFKENIRGILEQKA